METLLNEILKNELFDSNVKIKKIDVGFTNLLYLIDNKYIIKICNNKNNEEKFKKEIEFYLKNKNNSYIPKLYLYHNSISNDDYSYLVIEYIKGKTLYNVWHSLTNSERENIIDKIVELMKSFHSVKGDKYDWAEFIKNKLVKNFNICKEKKFFNNDEINLVNDVLNNVDPYLKSDDFCLIHSDIHFDNIIVDQDNDLKLIDFETSMCAPIDYELDIFLRMCHNPLKYASEDEEKLINPNDYKIIEPYFRKKYPEIFNIHDFDIRNKIYDLEANLRLLPRFPDNIELKDLVINNLRELKKMFSN